MVKKEIVNQEKALNRLQWLTQRSKVGFKGNPPSFDIPKTQASVALTKKRASDKLAGEAEFLPFRHSVSSLAEDSRPTKHLRGVDNAKFEKRVDRGERNYYYQRVDKSTGRPEIDSALCWDLKGPVASVQRAEEPYHSQPVAEPLSVSEKKRRAGRGFSNPHLATLSNAERTALYRADILNHPKFTRQSREFRAVDAWYQGTQLEGPLHVKARKHSPPPTRNCIRMHAARN